MRFRTSWLVTFLTLSLCATGIRAEDKAGDPPARGDKAKDFTLQTPAGDSAGSVADFLSEIVTHKAAPITMLRTMAKGAFSPLAQDIEGLGACAGCVNAIVIMKQRRSSRILKSRRPRRRFSTFRCRRDRRWRRQNKA